MLQYEGEVLTMLSPHEALNVSVLIFCLPVLFNILRVGIRL